VFLSDIVVFLSGFVRLFAGFGHGVVRVIAGFFAGLRWTRPENEALRHPGRSAAYSRDPGRSREIEAAAIAGLLPMVPDSGLRRFRDCLLSFG